MPLLWSPCRPTLGAKPSSLEALWLFIIVFPVYLGYPTAVYAEALAGSITVLAFTDSRWFPISQANSPEVKLTVYDLAAPKLAMANLNAQLKLPANPTLATAQAKDYLQSHQAELSKRILPTYEGLSKAINLGVSHYPALVFNGQAVIYGVTDIQEGLELYRNWQQGKPSP
jgi:integrating conjugative element protein (TIGR03757 family)